MARYISKPQEVGAVQWRGDNWNECHSFAGDKVWCRQSTWLFVLAGKDGVQGWVPVPVNHYIVHMPGDFTDIWPVDPEYFESKYEAVE